jgi:hypothetical protein
VPAQLLQVIANGGRQDCLEVLLAEPLEALMDILKRSVVGARLLPETSHRTHVRIVAKSYSESIRKRD